MSRLLLFVATFLAFTGTGVLADISNPRPGWEIRATTSSYGELVAAVRAAVSAAPIAIVTQASASDGARMQGLEIPGNRVFGLYRNDYARRMLEASVAAGIEAPIRMYVTENEDGSATLSYRTPSAVFAPYMSEGGADLAMLARELDAVFLQIADTAAPR
ncbi:MAG: DUF302 domain-containing protein [Halocynthiibacter sp.]